MKIGQTDRASCFLLDVEAVTVAVWLKKPDVDVNLVATPRLPMVKAWLRRGDISNPPNCIVTFQARVEMAAQLYLEERQ